MRSSNATAVNVFKWGAGGVNNSTIFKSGDTAEKCREPTALY